MATKKLSPKQQKIMAAKTKMEKYLDYTPTANNKRLYRYWRTRLKNLKAGK